MKKILIYSGATVILILILSIVAMHIWIGTDVRKNISIAQQKYPGTAEDAFISFLLDETNSYNDRTHVAIWTLGMIQSEKVYIPDHLYCILKRKEEKTVSSICCLLSVIGYQLPVFQFKTKVKIKEFSFLLSFILTLRSRHYASNLLPVSVSQILSSREASSALLRHQQQHIPSYQD